MQRGIGSAALALDGKALLVSDGTVIGWGDNGQCQTNTAVLPPGLAFTAVSAKAWKVAESFQPPAYYLDIKRYRKSLGKWSGTMNS